MTVKKQARNDKKKQEKLEDPLMAAIAAKGWQLLGNGRWRDQGKTVVGNDCSTIGGRDSHIKKSRRRERYLRDPVEKEKT